MQRMMGILAAETGEHFFSEVRTTISISVL